MQRIDHDRLPIHGHVSAGFERVREEFERNFSSRGERGAACTIYHRGEKVVDLWGGYRCGLTGTPWTSDTLSLCFSVTKGIAAATMAVAHSRGLFELDAPVAEYWPEFAAGNKADISVRQLLSHQAGLVSVDQRLNASILADHDQLADIIGRQRPLWQPGTRHGYHTLTLGWYQNELIRRVDRQRRSLGQFFQDEIAKPLGIEFYIGLPSTVDTDRVSTIRGFNKLEALAHINDLPPMMVLCGIWPWSTVAKSVRFLRFGDPAALGDQDFRGVEIPSANGIGQAQAVARLYDVLARGGRELGLNTATLRELVAPADAPAGGTRDCVLKMDTRYSFGFSRPSASMQFGVNHNAFGCPGAGGSFGMADPTLQLSFAYLTNTMGFRIFDDVREKAVRDACYECIADHSPQRAAA